MVRKDDVDPGGWNDICPSKLIVPLDTHMHRVSRAMGLTSRRQANGRTAEEITPGDALKAYLESKNIPPDRQKVLLEYGEKLIEDLEES